MTTRVRSNGARLLESWITSRRLQKQQAAALLEIHPANLSNYLSGERKPGLDTATRIEDKTGVPVRAWKESLLADSAKQTKRQREKANVCNE